VQNIFLYSCLLLSSVFLTTHTSHLFSPILFLLKTRSFILDYTENPQKPVVLVKFFLPLVDKVRNINGF
ncbi:MAG: hypothetical protein KAJ46_01520, partial [Sedimentisphaerales bacterium]|nr:hypothetical protein [Sedimentisphaerales bacterium]